MLTRGERLDGGAGEMPCVRACVHTRGALPLRTPPSVFATTMAQGSTLDTANMAPEEVLRKACAVCFDVDSTVITEEGIDALAAECGVGEQVAEWCVPIKLSRGTPRAFFVCIRGLI